ncbi:hypothetical protein EJK15_64020 [Nonomuraea basaltis]|nr:hypothetical protein EJK15_64020 [Nonomuraea basaltis]
MPARARHSLRPARAGLRPPHPRAAALTPGARRRCDRKTVAQLFLSPRTVGRHLHKAYPKPG